MEKGKKMLEETENWVKKEGDEANLCWQTEGTKITPSISAAHIQVWFPRRSRKRGLNAWNLNLSEPGEPADNGTGWGQVQSEPKGRENNPLGSQKNYFSSQ